MAEVLIPKFVEAAKYFDKKRGKSGVEEFSIKSENDRKRLIEDFNNLSTFTYALSVLMEFDRVYGLDELSKSGYYVPEALKQKLFLGGLKADYTDAKRLIKEISGETKRDDIEKLFVPTDEDSKRLERIAEELALSLDSKVIEEKVKKGIRIYPFDDYDYENYTRLFLTAADILDWEIKNKNKKG